VHDCAELVLLSHHSGGAELKYTALAFSRCGQYLLAVGDAPDFTLTVWDLDNGGNVVIQTQVTEELTGGNVSFFGGQFGPSLFLCVHDPIIRKPENKKLLTLAGYRFTLTSAIITVR
jgi:WD40 repeat protein